VKTGSKHGQKSVPENALAQEVFQENEPIDQKARQKKVAQLESLMSARTAVIERIGEMVHQIKQIDTPIETLTRRPASSRSGAERRNWSEVRERVGDWI